MSSEKIILPTPSDEPGKRGLIDKLKGMIKSRRFIIAAISVIAVVFSDLFVIEFDKDQATNIVTWILGAWIISDGIRET